jgi:large subunit ribosomal protein L28
MKCEICGKSTQFGHNVSHSKRRTNRPWKPNVHQTNIIKDGRKVRVKICTRCLRTHNKISGVA